MLVAPLALFVLAAPTSVHDVDSDGDGLSDFHEVHEHRTDPDPATVERVARWLLQHAEHHDGFTSFATAFDEHGVRDTVPGPIHHTSGEVW